LALTAAALTPAAMVASLSINDYHKYKNIYAYYLRNNNKQVKTSSFPLGSFGFCTIIVLNK
jgi:hypothetical protein